MPNTVCVQILQLPSKKRRFQWHCQLHTDIVNHRGKRSPKLLSALWGIPDRAIWCWWIKHQTLPTVFDHKPLIKKWVVQSCRPPAKPSAMHCHWSVRHETAVRTLFRQSRAEPRQKKSTPTCWLTTCFPLTWWFTQMTVLEYSKPFKCGAVRIMHGASLLDKHLALWYTWSKIAAPHWTCLHQTRLQQSNHLWTATECEVWWALQNDSRNTNRVSSQETTSK